MTIDQKVIKLQAQFPEISGIQDGEAWGAGDGTVHLGDAAEGGFVGNLPAADMYAIDHEEVHYVMGIHKELREALEGLDMYAEFMDGGTVIAYPC
jgi:hypothetical protein